MAAANVLTLTTGLEGAKACVVEAASVASSIAENFMVVLGDEMKK